MKDVSAVRIFCLVLIFALPVMSQVTECRIDFTNNGDGYTSFSGSTWNCKGYSTTSALPLLNTNGSSTGGVTVQLSSYYDSTIPDGAWGGSTTGWIYAGSGEGANSLLYTSSADPSGITINNLPSGLYRMDLVASYNAAGYVSNYQINGDFGVIRESNGSIVPGMTGQNYDPQQGYNNGRYISWSDIAGSAGNVFISISGINHNMINIMRIVYTGEESLPVELSLFQATPANGTIILEWRTESEVDVSGFRLMRAAGSENGFTCIAEAPEYPQLTARGSTVSGREYSFIDRDIEPDCHYRYRLYEIGLDGSETLLAETSASASSIPQNWHLYQNFPNPFNPDTRIEIDIPEQAPDSDCRLSIYNVNGQMVRQLFSGHLDAGRHSIPWDGRDDSGAALPGGIYLARFSAGGYTQTIRMVMVK